MRKLPVVAVLLCVLAMPAIPLAAQLPPECGTTLPLPDPYVFILFDISGSMNHAAPCTQAEYDAGQCAYVCSGGSQCHTPTQGDHPGSKWYQARQALYNVISGIDDVRFGFATFSDHYSQRVKAKHWLYQATTAGPAITGWGAFPAVGAQEVFGTSWSCAAGAGDGCSLSVPADLVDAWELTRVRRLPKGGDALTQTVEVYVRSGSIVYKVRYQPVSGTLGGPVQTDVTTWRCGGGACTTLIGTQTVSWEPVGDFLSWENAASTASRTQPYSFFNQAAASDSNASTVCSFNSGGWEPNGDDAADTFNSGISYNLKHPTDASDPRGVIFTKGDIIPLDWLDRHKQDILARLAPNLALDPLAAPDFRTASYFQDHAAPGEPFLRLHDESARPIVPFGPTALAWSIRNFYDWFSDGCGNKCPDPANWEDIAALEDPDWGCRRLHLLVITDSQEECNSTNPCADVADLRMKTSLRTSVIGIGQSPTLSPLRCMVDNGRGLGLYPKTRQQIEQALIDYFDWVRQP